MPYVKIQITREGASREQKAQLIRETTDLLVIRRKDVSVTAMTEEEAIEQMELLGHSFFVFFNPMTANINVVYRRRSEGYGVLNPQVE